MPVRERDFAGKAPRERAELRARAIAESDTHHPTFLHGDFTITVVEGPRVAGASVVVTLKAVHNPTEKDVPLDNPFIFINPPTMVPNGSPTTIEVAGEKVQVPTFVFAPRDAFRQMVADAVVESVRRSAWLP